MISEWSCDTEDWSNDAENTALPTLGINNILKYIKIKTVYNITVFLIKHKRIAQETSSKK